MPFTKVIVTGAAVTFTTADPLKAAVCPAAAIVLLDVVPAIGVPSCWSDTWAVTGGVAPAPGVAVVL